MFLTPQKFCITLHKSVSHRGASPAEEGTPPLQPHNYKVVSFPKLHTLHVPILLTTLMPSRKPPTHCQVQQLLVPSFLFLLVLPSPNNPNVFLQILLFHLFFSLFSYPMNWPFYGTIKATHSIQVTPDSLNSDS